MEYKKNLFITRMKWENFMIRQKLCLWAIQNSGVKSPLD